jgi:hypothetical protein
VGREEVRCGALAQRLDAGETQTLLDMLVRAGWLREVPVKVSGPGRPPRRWERAYEFSAARQRGSIPRAAYGRDIDDMRTKAGVERAVVDVLRKLGMLPPHHHQQSGCGSSNQNDENSVLA